MEMLSHDQPSKSGTTLQALIILVIKKRTNSTRCDFKRNCYKENGGFFFYKRENLQGGRNVLKLTLLSDVKAAKQRSIVKA
jgi:hypothetical protein